MTISISSEAQKNWNIQTGKMGWWSSCSVVSHNKRERDREREIMEKLKKITKLLKNETYVF